MQSTVIHGCIINGALKLKGQIDKLHIHSTTALQKSPSRVPWKKLMLCKNTLFPLGCISTEKCPKYCCKIEFYRKTDQILSVDRVTSPGLEYRAVLWLFMEINYRLIASSLFELNF